jgi:hypothetical protein
MTASCIVYVFVGEVVFAAMAGVALLALAALLRVMPSKLLQGHISGSRGHLQAPANAGTDGLNELDEFVDEGMQTSSR